MTPEDKVTRMSHPQSEVEIVADEHDLLEQLDMDEEQRDLADQDDDSA